VRFIAWLALPALAFGACTRERERVTIDGISATVAPGSRPLAPERVEKLREAVLSSGPGVEVAMAGRRPESAPLPWMYLQRSVVRPHVLQPLEVSKVLDGTLKELRATLAESGLEVLSSTSSIIDDTQETCFSTRSNKGEASVTNHTCLRLWVGAETRAVHTVSVVCMALSSEAEECERVLASRAVTPGPHLPLSAKLEP
jgi:hypothetical protein